MSDIDIDAVVKRLDDAWEKKTGSLDPLTRSEGLRVEDSYAVQTRWTQMRLANGDGISGRKIGLTSKAMQEMLGVSEPDYGTLWSSRFFATDANGHVEVPADIFVSPRVEGEIAFLIAEPLASDDVTAEDVLAATEAVAASVEIVDSRITDWEIELADTIADNASYGGYTLGPWDRNLKETNLRALGMIASKNGENVIQAVGAAALGHPANAVAWLARKLHSFDITLNPGDVVLSGSLGGMVPVERGDTFTLEFYGQPSLTVDFV